MLIRLFSHLFILIIHFDCCILSASFSIDHNNHRIETASTESELWKITKEVTNPKNENNWKIDDNYLFLLFN